MEQKEKGCMLWDRVDFHQDFKITSIYANNRGIYYPETKRSIVFLAPHENVEDIISTAVHETIHSVIDDIDTEGELDEDIEHDIISKMIWAEYSLTNDTTDEEVKLTRKFNRAFSRTLI